MTDLPALRLRTGGATDTGAVVALVESAYRGELSRAGWTTEADLLAGRRTGADEVGPAIGSFLLALDGEELVGCARVETHDGVGHFGTFAVLPTRQGGGVGRALLAAAEQQVRDAGGRVLEITVINRRTELLDYYRRHGFELTGESQPFPYGDERFGIPLRDDLAFTVLRKPL